MNAFTKGANAYKQADHPLTSRVNAYPSPSTLERRWTAHRWARGRASGRRRLPLLGGRSERDGPPGVHLRRRRMWWWRRAAVRASMGIMGKKKRKNKVVSSRPIQEPKRQPAVADPRLLRVNKRPVVPSIDTLLSFHPSWRFAALDIEGQFGWSSVDRGELEEIRTKLGEYERLTWGEIKIQQADRNHLIGIASMSRAAQARLRQILPGVEELFSLRITGKKRIFGIIQDHGAMLLVWWDRHHQVCPTKK